MTGPTIIALVVKTTAAWTLLFGLRHAIVRLGPARRHWVGVCGMLSIALMGLMIVVGGDHRIKLKVPFSAAAIGGTGGVVEVGNESPPGAEDGVGSAAESTDAPGGFGSDDGVASGPEVTSPGGTVTRVGDGPRRASESSATPIGWFARQWPNVLFVFYACVAGSMLACTVAVWISTAVRVRRLPRLEPTELRSRLREEWVEAFGVVLPVVHLSGAGRMPHVSGAIRPRLVLPADWRTWSRDDLRCIVLHELAHVRRRDLFTARVMRLVVILYWWQPLAHRLRRDLRDDREAACDDEVLRAGVRRSDYAACLSRLIRTLSASSRPDVVVAMAGGSSSLRRVERVLKSGRLSTSFGRPGAAVLLAGGLVFGAMAGTLTLVNAEPPGATEGAEEPEGAEPRERPDDDFQIPVIRPADLRTPDGFATAIGRRPTRGGDDAGDPALPRTLVVDGRTIDVDGNPIAGVELWTLVDRPPTLRRVGVSDARGRFRLDLDRTAFQTGRNVLGTRTPATVYLAAVKDGLAVTHSTIGSDGFDRIESDPPVVTRRLEMRAERPVEITVVDTAGEPVEDAVVRVVQSHDLSTGRWHKMVDAVARQDPDLMTRREADIRVWADVFPIAMAGVYPEGRSDDSGRVRLSGIAAEQACEIEVGGPGVVPYRLGLVGSPGGEALAAKMRAKYPRPREEPASDSGLKLYGDGGSVPVRRTQTIAGRIVDHLSGSPLAGVRVVASRRQAWSVGRTDRRGFFRIYASRPTISDAVTLRTIAPKQTHLGVRRTVRLTEAGGEADADFGLRRCVRLSGVVRRGDTGGPIASTHKNGWHTAGPGPLVSGRAHYFPLAETDFGGPPPTVASDRPSSAADTLTYGDVMSNGRHTALIDGEGRFEIYVPPGRGVLLVDATPWKSMSSSAADLERWPTLPRYQVVAQNVAGSNRAAASVRFDGADGPIDASGYHAFRVFDVDAGSPPLSVEFDLEMIGTLGVLPGRAARTVWDRLGEDSLFLWQSPTFDGFDGKAYFGDSDEAGATLDGWVAEEFPAVDLKNVITSQDFLNKVRRGLMRMTKSPMPVLRHISNEAIWHVDPPNPRAVELMWRAADPDAGFPDYLQYNAVYFGLSVAEPKTPTLIEGLVRIAALTDNHETLRRIAWSLKGHRQEALTAYDRLPLPIRQRIADADDRRLILAGELDATDWHSRRQLTELRQRYGDRIEEIRRELIELVEERFDFEKDAGELDLAKLSGEQWAMVADRSRRRREWIERMGKENIYRLWDESFVEPLARLARDPDHLIRRGVIIRSGLHWVWRGSDQPGPPPGVIDMMLRASRDEHPEVRYNAVYYGLSVIHPRPPRVTRRINEMLEANPDANYAQRLRWGLSR